MGGRNKCRTLYVCTSPLTILGTLCIIAGALSPFWWQVQMTMDSLGAFNIGTGLFQTCTVWFCAKDTADSVCNASELAFGDNRALKCEANTDLPAEYETEWFIVQLMAVISIVFAIVSSTFMLVDLCLGCCCGERGASTKQVAGAVFALLAGVCAIVSIVLFSIISAFLDFEQQEANLGNLIEGKAVFGFSFWFMVGGACLEIVGGVIMAFTSSSR